MPTLEEVKKFLEENAETEEVKTYLSGFKKVGVEDVKTLAEEDAEIKSWMDSQKDTHANKSLETWKTNNLQKLIDEKVKEKNPDKPEWEIELEKVKADLENERNLKKREALKNKALTIASDKKIPTTLIDFFLGEDDESITKNLSTFEESMKSYVDAQVKERIKGGSHTPPAGDDKGDAGSSFFDTIKENQVQRN